MKQSYHTPGSLYTQLDIFELLSTVEEPAAPMKLCPRCDPPVPKPLHEFNHDRNRADGHYPICKECYHIYNNSEDRKKKRRAREQAKSLEQKQEKYRKHKQWRKENQEDINLRSRIKYATDPTYATRVRRNTDIWNANNPLKRKEETRRYFARRQETTVDPVDYEKILERDGSWCYICSQDILLCHTLHFDHVIPLKPRKGEPQGTHTEDNIKPTHSCCNKRKSNKPVAYLTMWDRRGPDKTIRERGAIYIVA